MDRDLSRRYLSAMGVQVWRLRGGDTAEEATEETAGDAPESPRSGLQAAAPDTAKSAPSESGYGVPRTAASAVGDAGVGMELDRLRQAVSSCRACELCKTRTQTVFGVGSPQADLMIVGEAPGADEDRQGEPFVGRAGQLLNQMLAAIGLAREQVYIANILKCRPPGNRDPRPEEALRCEPFLMRQVALVQPRVLLSVGRVSAQKLLSTDMPIGRLRGRWLELGPDRTPLMVTYHPAYLLRSPDQKAKVWQDLLRVAGRLREPAADSGPDCAG